MEFRIPGHGSRQEYQSDWGRIQRYLPKTPDVVEYAKQTLIMAIQPEGGSLKKLDALMKLASGSSLEYACLGQGFDIDHIRRLRHLQHLIHRERQKNA